ncbi:MAG: DUF2147 domain-containing protein [Pseudomonadota bacterium]
MNLRVLGWSIAVWSCALQVAAAGDLTALAGEWRTVRHGADVEIRDCGDGSPCGFLIFVSTDITGGEVNDVRNNDPSLRDRPLDGLPILWGFSKRDKGWYRGKLYNPDTGQTFRSSMELISPDELKVKGCLGPLCRQQTWVRLHSIQTKKQGE